MRVRGVVAVAPVDGDAYELLAQRQRLETMASLVAIAVERVHYVDVAQRTQVQIGVRAPAQFDPLGALARSAHARSPRSSASPIR